MQVSPATRLFNRLQEFAPVRPAERPPEAPKPAETARAAEPQPTVAPKQTAPAKPVPGRVPPRGSIIDIRA
jgi:hypothetical protein